ncbi:hypothetical protein FGD67_18650 [Colwellia sp. M166]|uniref:hypothetical protein n=1 Tax=Colwellia sp. M166 TaxID=2583805 RepID=UPI00211ED3B2|nr:hypothetical protein [Colwellia sp. M166]UUO25007.1 hypothetical protein FGD67_18650 [Colwellia sp. M166]|tara:strand:- start:321 stop:767 length:447 start_codon:yes stop_codon:yes gene_type:complete
MLIIWNMLRLNLNTDVRREVDMVIAHGEVSIFLQNENIIIAKLKGAFNEYGAQEYTDGIKQIITQLDGQNFSILINLLELMGGTPEAYKELEDYNKWLNSQNLLAKAMVINSMITLDIINMYSPSRGEQKSETFDNETDAIAWLKTLT